MMKPLLFASLLLAATQIHAQGAAPVTVNDAWVRATVASQTSTGAFMQIVAPNGARLVGARSPVASTVEIHEMALVSNVMKMRAIPSVELPAGKPVDLKPGGYHMMLMGLKKPVAAGDHVMLTLVVEGKDRKRSNVEVHAMVRPINTVDGAPPKGEAMKMAH